MLSRRHGSGLLVTNLGLATALYLRRMGEGDGLARHTWYDVRQRSQRRLDLRDLMGILGDEVIVEVDPLGRQRDHFSNCRGFPGWPRR